MPHRIVVQYGMMCTVTNETACASARCFDPESPDVGIGHGHSRRATDAANQHRPVAPGQFRGAAALRCRPRWREWCRDGAALCRSRARTSRSLCCASPPIQAPSMTSSPSSRAMSGTWSKPSATVYVRTQSVRLREQGQVAMQLLARHAARHCGCPQPRAHTRCTAGDRSCRRQSARVARRATSHRAGRARCRRRQRRASPPATTTGEAAALAGLDGPERLLGGCEQRGGTDRRAGRALHPEVRREPSLPVIRSNSPPRSPLRRTCSLICSAIMTPIG